MTHKKRILLDVDTGIDDAMAILFALLSPEIEVVGITTVFGNIDVGQATDNTLRLIKLANCGYEVPVAVGAAKPLERAYGGPTIHVHGHNGIGDVELPPSEQKALAQSAEDFIISKAHEFPGELIIVPVGRMTNVAAAVQKDPSIAGMIKQVVIMGGTVFAPGNVTPVSEANFYGDPEAAAILFESPLPLTVVGLDVTMKVLLSRQHLDVLESNAPDDKLAIIRFLKHSMEWYMRFYEESNGFIGECPMHDPLAVLVAIDSTLVHTQKLNAAIDCGHDMTAGMIIADRRYRPVIGREIEFCLHVDEDRAMKRLLSVFASNQ
ncbi:nucleoside hydrolase [Paenibacillus sp. NEAU-GSW1]|uniref:nucleoside hydrolase n=1 Tax=Paenibacillus sp. NEAU-GSW1 TaxID=2682486 RepID=UPI0012E12201|nr:nucleoside hydrolase [Paenibacillus sp. NEAU-GSW1]MUT67088.1 nucleoside hydrolase [Paenibacillus sp. NEAU-GSW1]